MKSVRDSAFIWVTWAASYLAGTAHCYYSAWLRAHYQNVDLVKSDFDQAAWIMNHSEMVNTTRLNRENEGWKVKLEDQNKFIVEGNSGTKLSGKPDIVSVKDNEVVVIDCKTGKPRVSDVSQVQIYIFALERKAEYKGKKFRGELHYKDHVLVVPGESVNNVFKGRLFQTLSTLSSLEQVGKTPSFDECKFCPISHSECEERISIDPNKPITGFFNF